MSFTEAQIRRYSRQILLPDLGGVGQTQILQTVIDAQVGDAATDVALAYLVAAGITTLYLRSDGAIVCAEHLVASTLLGPADMGRDYLEAVSERLQLHNPELQIRTNEAPATSLSLSIPGHRATCTGALSAGTKAATMLLLGLRK